MGATKTEGAKVQRAIVGSTAFLLILFGLYFVHMRYFRVDVVFYSVLFDVAVATVLCSALLAWAPYFAKLGTFEKLQMGIVWMLLGYIFAISVPTVIDRSLSFYILEKIQQRGGGVRLDRFPDIFAKEYLREHQLVAVRLTEQQSSGTITIDGQCVHLTPRGQALASFSRFYRQHLLPRQRRLLGRYTDELTDPFRHSDPGADDACP